MTKQEKYFEKVNEIMSKHGYRLYMTMSKDTPKEQRVYTTNYISNHIISIYVKQGLNFKVVTNIKMCKIETDWCSPLSNVSHFRNVEGWIIDVISKYDTGQKQQAQEIEEDIEKIRGSKFKL